MLSDVTWAFISSLRRCIRLLSVSWVWALVTLARSLFFPVYERHTLHVDIRVVFFLGSRGAERI